MAKLKQLRSGLANAFKLTRNAKGSEKASAKLIRSSETPSQVALTRYVTEAEGITRVSTRTILSRLISKEHFLYASERQQVPSFASAVDALLYRKNYSELEELKKLYDLIDPEKDILSDQALSRKERLDKELELLQKISGVLDQGKFTEIPVNSILGQYNTNRGIVSTANPSEYETLRVWARGLITEVKKPLPFYKKAYHYIWKSTSDNFTHVFTAVRQKSGGEKLWLKVYKQTPREELLGLLPAGVTRLSNLNRWVLRISTISGASAVIILSLYQSQFLWAILLSSLLTGGWSVGSYMTGRNKFLCRVAALQYHHCVASNWGAIVLAVNLVRENLVKDILLAYLFLLAPPNRPDDPKAVFSSKQPIYHTANSLKSAVEEWLDQTFNCSVKYNAEVAITRLDELGLLVRKQDNKLSVLSMEDALELLPNPPSPWEMKMLQENLMESELTQNWPMVLQWK